MAGGPCLECPGDDWRWVVGAIAPGPDLPVYSQNGPVTNSVLNVSLGIELPGRKQISGRSAIVVCGAQRLPSFLEIRASEIRPLAILMAEQLWIIESAGNDVLRITPAIRILRDRDSKSISELDAIKMCLGESTFSDAEIGEVPLRVFVDSLLLSTPRSASVAAPSILKLAAIEASTIRVEVVLEGNAPLRITFDQSFQVMKIEREGMELAFNKGTAKQAHDRWRASLADRLKRNQQAK